MNCFIIGLIHWFTEICSQIGYASRTSLLPTIQLSQNPEYMLNVLIIWNEQRKLQGNQYFHFILNCTLRFNSKQCIQLIKNDLNCFTFYSSLSTNSLTHCTWHFTNLIEFVSYQKTISADNLSILLVHMLIIMSSYHSYSI